MLILIIYAIKASTFVKHCLSKPARCFKGLIPNTVLPHLRFEQAQPKIWAWWTFMKKKRKFALQGWKSTFLFLETYFRLFFLNFELLYLLTKASQKNLNINIFQIDLDPSPPLPSNVNFLKSFAPPPFGKSLHLDFFLDTSLRRYTFWPNDNTESSF